MSRSPKTSTSTNNEKLSSLAGLANLVGIGRNVLIVDNGNLPTSEAQALADQAAAGEVFIADNAN